MRKKLLVFILILFPIMVDAKVVNQYTYTKNESLYWTGLDTVGLGYNSENVYPIYDYVDENGYFHNVYQTNDLNYLYWSSYDKSMKMTNTIKIPMYFNKDNLDTIGEIFYHPFAQAIYKDGYLYVAYTFPATNKSLGSVYTQKVLAIVKYDTDGNVIVSKDYTGEVLNASNYQSGGSQIIAYGTSSVSMTLNNDELTLFFGRNMYNSHESSLFAVFDKDTLTHKSVFYKDYSMELGGKYYKLAQLSISHSLGQRIITTSDNEYLAVELGDAYPRGVVLTKTALTYDSEYDLNYYEPRQLLMSSFSESAKGSNGNNIINYELGNIIELDDGYLLVGATTKNLTLNWSSYMNNPYNLYVQKYKKDIHSCKNAEGCQLFNVDSISATGDKPTDTSRGDIYLTGKEINYGMNFLTDFNNSSIMMLRAVKLNNNNVAIFFEERAVTTSNDKLTVDTSKKSSAYYMVIDHDANIIVPKTKLDNVTLSGEEHYVYHDGYVYFSSIYDKTITVNKIDVLNQIESINLDKSEVSIDYNHSIKINATLNPSDTFMDKTIKWTSSNPLVADVDQSGTITAKYPGSAVITATTSNDKKATVKVNVTGDYPVVKGDINGDNKITLSDVLLLIKIYFGKITPTNVQVIAGDFNGNSKIDLSDISSEIKLYFNKN